MRRKLNTLFGVLFEVFVADFFTVLGLTGQKWAIETANDDHLVQASSTITNKKWIAYFLVFLFGQASEAFSLSLASQTDIASVSNLTLVWNAIFAYTYFGETFNLRPSYKPLRTELDEFSTVTTPLLGVKHQSWYHMLTNWDLLHYLLLILGSSLIVVTAPISIDYANVTFDQLLENWLRFPFAAYAIVMIVAILSAVFYLKRDWKNDSHAKLNSTLIASLAGILSSMTLTLSKMFMTILQKLTFHDFAQSASTAMIVFCVLLLVFWICLMVSSIYVLNLGLSRFEQGRIVPLYEIIGTVMTIISGILFYKSYSDFSTSTFCTFSFGIVLLCVGIFLVSLREERRSVQNSS